MVIGHTGSVLWIVADGYISLETRTKTPHLENGRWVGNANGVLCFDQNCVGYYHVFTAKQTKSSTPLKLRLCMKIFTNLIVFANKPKILARQFYLH